MHLVSNRSTSSHIQNAPLLGDEGDLLKIPDTDIAFINFDENEESTCMHSITLMRTSFFKSYLVVPILSFLTIFILPLKMYWDNALYAKWIFNHVTKID